MTLPRYTHSFHTLLSCALHGIVTLCISGLSCCLAPSNSVGALQEQTGNTSASSDSAAVQGAQSQTPDSQSAAPSAGQTSDPNETRSEHPPSVATTPLSEWETVRYAFTDGIRYSSGSASGEGVEIYLTANANFCVDNASQELVGGVLSEGESFYLLELLPAIRETRPGDYTGPGNYGFKLFKKQNLIRAGESIALSPNTCGVTPAAHSYHGDVTVLSDDANGMTFAVSGFALETTPAPSPDTYAGSLKQFTARPCAVLNAAYSREPVAQRPPYSIWTITPLLFAPCRYKL